jgi:putative DNA primase/helicase
MPGDRLAVVADLARAKQRGKIDTTADDMQRPVEYSDDALALAFTQAHGDRWRYVHAWGKWFLWTGSVWQEDRTLRHFDLARAVCRSAAERAAKMPGVKNDKREKIADSIRSSRTTAAVVTLARADRVHACNVEQWDSDPWLLNTPAGEVDLQSGVLKPHRAESYCTKQTAVGPDGGNCDTWLRFLDRVTGRNDELIAYLQRVCGYALVGVVREHALVFLYGLGANGKSTFINTVAAILGSYAQTAPMDTFTETPGASHPTELAMLRGARLVTATETEDGRRWAEARIKELTGGDKIAARFMRQDFFEFVPQFTLVISGNHKPSLRSVGEAMRRRLHLVPFTQTIPAAERDSTLPDRLREEWPAILSWMVRGCLEWQAMGLSPPEMVREATDEYLDAEDTLGIWLQEATERDPNAVEATAELHKAYQKWAERAGERFLGTKRFSQALEERGFQKTRTAALRGFLGLRLVAPAKPAAEKGGE